MNSAMFDLYLTTQLVPRLHKGNVAILDNLSSHNRAAAHRALREICAGVLFYRRRPIGTACLMAG